MFVHRKQWFNLGPYLTFLEKRGKEYELIPDDEFIPCMREIVARMPTCGSGPSQDAKLLGIDPELITDLQAQTDYIFTKADLMGVPHFPDEEVAAFMEVVKREVPNPAGISFLDFARASPSSGVDLKTLETYAQAALEAGLMTQEYADNVFARFASATTGL